MFVPALVLLFLLRIRFPRHEPISRTITRRYGPQALRTVRQLEKNSLKLEKNNCDLVFLKTCKAYNVMPKFLRFKLYNKRLHDSQLYKSWQCKLLNLEINSKSKHVINLENRCESLMIALKSLIRVFDFVILKNFINTKNEKELEKMKNVHKRKLCNLGISNELQPMDPEKVIFNFSNKILSEREKQILVLGLDFGLPHFKLDFYKYFLSFEKLFNSLKSCQPYLSDENVVKR